MDRRFTVRMCEAMEDAIVDARVFRDVQPRLEVFLEPLVAGLREAEQQVHARNYVTGLLADLKRKNVESVVYWHDQERLPLQKVHGLFALGPSAAVGGAGAASRRRAGRGRPCQGTLARLLRRE